MTTRPDATSWTAPWPTIPAVLEHQVGVRGAQEAVVDGTVRLSYRDLWQRSGALARAMAARGVTPGDRVVAWLPNCWQAVVVACATWRCGAELVPANTRNRAPEIVELVRLTGAPFVVTVARFLEQDYDRQLVDALGELDSPPLVVSLGAEAPAGAIALGTLFDEGDRLSTDLPAVEPDDVCEVLFTSGTTGEAKGVFLDHRQVVEAYWAYGQLAGLEGGDRYLMVMPFGHGGGLNGCIVTSLIHGLTIVTLDVFEPVHALALLERERITVMLGPPTVYLAVLDEPNRRADQTGTLRVAITGAAMVAPLIIERIHDELGAPRVINAYGIIEATVVSMTRADDSDDVVGTTTGRALPGVEIRLVGGDGVDVAADTPGEVLVRSYGVTRGYLVPEQTSAAIDADGWFHTGDVGVMDAAGNLRIVDRTKDVISVGGFTAYPAEIERTMLHHPAVAAIAAVGIDDPRLGEVPCAFVVARSDASVTADDLIAWTGERLANYKVPRRVVFVDALPLNRTDKVDKHALRALAETATDS